MNTHKKFVPQQPRLLSAICGSLLIGSTLPFAASAQTPVQTLNQLNPCPGIYYEEPFNQFSQVPEGCPPNAVSQQLSLEREIPTFQERGEVEMQTLTADNRQVMMTPTALETTPAPMATPATTPLPLEQGNAIARVMPINNRVEVVLRNDTNTAITYEAIGHTQQRSLPGGRQITLRGLPAATTISMVRQDNGFLQPTAVSTEPGRIVLSLREEGQFLDSNQGTLRIEQDGTVFFN